MLLLSSRFTIVCFFFVIIVFSKRKYSNIFSFVFVFSLSPLFVFSNFVVIWLFIELNLYFFLYYTYTVENSKSKGDFYYGESSFYYYKAQSYSSFLFMTSCFGITVFQEFPDVFDFLTFICFSSLAFKIGLAPFHF